MTRAPTLAIGLAATLALAQAPLGAAPRPAETPDDAIEAAFLREDFAEVVERAGRWLAQADLTTLAAQDHEEAGRLVRVWVWYVLSLERLHGPPRALEELERLTQALAPLSADARQAWMPEALFWEAEISRRMGGLMRAQLAYQRLVTQFPASSWKPHAQVGLASVLFSQQAYKTARQHAREVLRLSPNASVAPQAQLLVALADLKLGDVAEAARLLRGLAQQATVGTVRAQAAFYLGEALTTLGETDRAIEAYRGAIDADPASPWARFARFGLGWSHFQRDECRESLWAFADYLSAPSLAAPAAPSAAARSAEVGVPMEQGSVLEMHVVGPALLFAQGRCLMVLGLLPEAAHCFETVRREFPARRFMVEATLSLAEVLAADRRPAEASRALESLLEQELTPGQRAQVLVRLGAVELSLGRAEQALRRFALVERDQDPELRQAGLTGRGDAEVFLGHEAEARQAFEEALRLNASSRGGLYAAYQLSRLDAQAGRVAQAIERLRGVIAQADPLLAAEARLALAFAYFAAGQAEAARAELDRVGGPDERGTLASRTNYYRGLIVLEQEGADRAMPWFQQVVTGAPDSEEAFEARLLLGDLMASERAPEEALRYLQGVVEAFAAVRTPAGLGWRRGRLLNRMADLARELRAYGQAIQWYEAARVDLPGHAGELDYRVASCYEEAGDLDLAIARYRAIRKPPWEIRGQLAAAKLMERQEQWQEATAIYRGIVRRATPEAKVAQERLAAIRQMTDIRSP